MGLLRSQKSGAQHPGLGGDFENVGFMTCLRKNGHPKKVK